MRRLLLALVVGCALATPAFAGLKIQVNSDSVVIDGVRKGGSVVLLHCALRPQKYNNFLEREARVLADINEAGQITFVVKVPLRSIWIAIDVESGQAAAGTPAGFEVIERDKKLNVRTHGNGEPFKIESSLVDGAMLVVRPGAGAWFVAAHKGAGLDTEPNTAALVLDSASIKPVSGTSALDDLRSGDITAMIDTDDFSYSVVKVK